MRVVNTIFQLVFLSSFLVGCMQKLPPGAVGPGTYLQKMDMRFNLLKRSYQVHVPPSYDPDRPLSLVSLFMVPLTTPRAWRRPPGSANWRTGE